MAISNSEVVLQGIPFPEVMLDEFNRSHGRKISNFIDHPFLGDRVIIKVETEDVTHLDTGQKTKTVMLTFNDDYEIHRIL